MIAYSFHNIMMSLLKADLKQPNEWSILDLSGGSERVSIDIWFA